MNWKLVIDSERFRNLLTFNFQRVDSETWLVSDHIFGLANKEKLDILSKFYLEIIISK